jgi:hypothetical protein
VQGSVLARGLAGASLAVLVASASAVATGPAAPDSLEEMPSASRESVTQLLEKVRRDYGPHAVVIQSDLLLNAMRNGSHLATAVRVEGVQEYRGTRYLRFHLETGMIFDDLTRDADARIHVLWTAIMEPTLEHVRDLKLAADGIQVHMQYHHRPYRTVRELRETIDEPGVSEETSFYVLASDIVRPEVSVRDLFAHCRITVDGAERPVPPPRDPPTMPGPL